MVIRKASENPTLKQLVHVNKKKQLPKHINKQMTKENYLNLPTYIQWATTLWKKINEQVSKDTYLTYKENRQVRKYNYLSY